MAKTNALRDACLAAIREEARASIDALIENGLDQWTGTALFLTAKPDDLQHINPDYSGPNEWQEVERLIRVLREEVDEALDTWKQATRPAWRISIEHYALRQHLYPYANTRGFDMCTDETSTLIGNGLFSQWRTADAMALARQIEEHALVRMQYVHTKTLDDFYIEGIANHEETPVTIRRMYSDTWNAAEPAVQLQDATGAESCAVSALRPSNVRVLHALRDLMPSRCQRSEHVSDKRWVLLRILSGITPKRLAAWELWQRKPPEKENSVLETGG